MDYTKYQNKLEYPKKPAKPLPPRNPGIDGNSKAYLEYSKLLKEYEKELLEYPNSLQMKEYKKLEEKYKEENDRLLKLFKHDCLDENGLLNHPKAEKAWEIAWREGHSLGYIDIDSVMSYLAELLIGE
jgi:hypothetical protein